MKKKLIAGVALAGVIGLVLTGCGSAKDDNKLVIWTNMEVETATIQEYAQKWSEATGNEIEVIHETPDVQQFVQAANSASGPDAVVGIANDQLANYVNAGLAAKTPENVYNDADFSNAAIQACYVNGIKYAAPVAVETVTLFYNTDKIAQAPQTWDELLSLAADNGGIQFDATSIYYDLGFVRAYDGYIFNYENGAYDVNDIGLGNDGAVRAYEYINSLCQDYGFLSADVSSDIAKSNFQNGVTAFYIGGPWDVDGFTSVGTPFAVAEMPTLNDKNFVTPVGTQVSFVSAKSDKQEMAWEFIMYLIDNGAMALYETGNRIPAKLVNQEDSVLQNNEISKAFIAQINNGEPMPTVSELGQVWPPYANNIKALFNGQLTAKEAAQNMVSQITEGVELMNAGK